VITLLPIRCCCGFRGFRYV